MAGSFCQNLSRPVSPLLLQQLLYWNMRTTSWTFDSSTAHHILTGCQTSWTSSLGLCHLLEKRVRAFWCLSDDHMIPPWLRALWLPVSSPLFSPQSQKCWWMCWASALMMNSWWMMKMRFLMVRFYNSLFIAAALLNLPRTRSHSS